MSYRPEPVHYQERTRAPGRWAVGLALAASAAATFIALSLWQLTDAGTAKPALRDALHALVEGDAVVARNYDDLRARAEATQSGDTLELRDYPVAVPLSREEVLASSQADITITMLDRGVEALYDDGAGAFRDENSGADPGRFTAAGAVGEFMGFLRGDVHAILGVLALVLAGISVVLAIMLAALCRGFGRAVALGAVTLVASLPLLLGGIAAHLYARASADGGSEYVRREFMQIAQDLAWLPVRNGLALVALGAAVMVAGSVCARIADGRRA
jgi:hypothetical protein